MERWNTAVVLVLLFAAIITDLWAITSKVISLQNRLSVVENIIVTPGSYLDDGERMVVRPPASKEK